MDFVFRFGQAERYLSKIGERTTRASWVRQARSAMKPNADPVLGLALIHPFQTEQVFPNPTDLRGERLFSGVAPLFSQTCEAVRFWGYDCGDGETLQADHDWPYSLGGPTAVGNLTWLCRVHNQSKGGDIHCWPWESTTPAWVGAHLVELLNRI